MDKIDNYTILEKIGEGTNANVYLVEDEQKNKFVLKYYRLIKDNERFNHEIKVLKLLNNYYKSIKYYDNKSYKDGKYIITEYNNSISLPQYLKENKSLVFSQLIQLTEDLLNIIDYLYKKYKILHLDLMASNIVYNKKDFFIIDFGNSKSLDYVKTLNLNFNSLYLAPEVYYGFRTIESEIYSLGCILYYAASHGNINGMFNLTIKSSKAEKIYSHIYKKVIFDNQIDKRLVPILIQMLEKNPKKRISIEELKKVINSLKMHEEVEKNIDFHDTFEIYKKMADDNIVIGLYKMGIFHLNGYHVSKDLEIAKNYFEKAIKYEYPEAYFHLAKILKNENKTKSQYLFAKASKYGLSKADLYLNDNEKKIDFLKKNVELLMENKEYLKAIENIKKLLLIHKRSSFYNLLGICYKKIDNIDDAIQSFENGLKLEPEKKTILANLIDLYLEQYDFEKTQILIKKLSSSYPESTVVYKKYAILYKELHLYDKAIESYKKVLDIELNNSIKNDLGQLLILQKKFKEGFFYREARLEFPKNKSISKTCKGKLFQGQNLKGKTILVYREQGLGDTVQYLRYLIYLKQEGAKVLFRVNPPLEELVSYLGIADTVFSNNEMIRNLSYDYHVSLLSLPYYHLIKYGNLLTQTPYINFPSQKNNVINIDNNKFNIGIVWEGGQKSANNDKRNVDLKYFSQLFDIDGLQMYSLQLSRQNQAIYEYGYENKIIDLSYKLSSFMDTANIINKLELIISVDTSVAHLSGAMSCETWMPMQYTPEYRWGLDDEYSYWYPSIKLFREKTRKKNGNWDDTFDSIKRELNIRVKKFLRGK